MIFFVKSTYIHEIFQKIIIKYHNHPYIDLYIIIMYTYYYLHKFEEKIVKPPPPRLVKNADSDGFGYPKLGF